MRIEYEPELLEESVFRALHCGEFALKPLAAEYHRRAEPLYAMPEGHSRDAAFQKLQTEMFEKAGLQRPIDEVFACFPHILKKVERAVFISAQQRREEEAELFGGTGQPFSIVTRLCVNTLINSAAFDKFAYHEFSRIDDMLNDIFGYMRKAEIGGENRVQQDIVRDRFRELWDILIDARLARVGRPITQDESCHRSRFTRLFGSSEITQQIFAKLWTLDLPDAPRHQALLRASEAPQTLCDFVGIDHVIQEAEMRRFANLCPICNCATREWEPNAELLPQSVIARIKSRKPEWFPAKGVCRQCVEFFNEAVPVRECGGVAT